MTTEIVLQSLANARRSQNELTTEIQEFMHASQCTGPTGLMEEARVRAHCALDNYLDQMATAHSLSRKMMPK